MLRELSGVWWGLVYVVRVKDFGVACGTVKSTKLNLKKANLRKVSSQFLEIYVPRCPSL